jgi:hypothetical protein
MTDVYASGTAGQDDKLGGVTQHEGAPPINLPLIVPSNFKNYARYWLKSDGHVVDQQTGTTLDTDGSWQGWVKSGNKWGQNQSGSPTLPDGFYYVDGDAIINAEVGTSADPWHVTIVATGYVKVPSNPHLRDYKQNTPAQGHDNLFLIAGCDLDFNGNANTSVTEGIMAAREEI